MKIITVAPSLLQTCLVLTTGIMFCICLPASASENSLAILGIANMEKGDAIRDEVREQCALESHLPGSVHRYARKAYRNVFLSNNPKNPEGHLLELDIMKVHAPKGGKYSGAKFMIVKGRLKNQKGKIIGSFEGQRTTGAFKMGFSAGRTCKFLHKVSRALGKDIGIWLRNPSMNSYIGEMRDRKAPPQEDKTRNTSPSDKTNTTI